MLYVLLGGKQNFGSVNLEIRIIEGRITEVLLYFEYNPPTRQSKGQKYTNVS